MLLILNNLRRMKDALHLSLRKNNLRVLNLKSKIDLPLTLISAVTEENCLRNKDLGSFQGDKSYSN